MDINIAFLTENCTNNSTNFSRYPIESFKSQIQNVRFFLISAHACLASHGEGRDAADWFEAGRTFSKLFLSALFFKIRFGCTANRTFPVIGKIFKLCPGRNIVVRIPLFRVINITAKCAYILIHLITWFTKPTKNNGL